MSGPASDLIRRGAPQGCRPFERFLLTPTAFAALRDALPAEPALALLSLWAEPASVHAAFLDEAEGGLVLASCPASEGAYPALSPVRPGAVRLERAIRDLWGLRAEGALDLRPWLDHGRWPVTAPLSARPSRDPVAPLQPAFLPVEGAFVLPGGLLWATGPVWLHLALAAALGFAAPAGFVALLREGARILG